MLLVDRTIKCGPRTAVSGLINTGVPPLVSRLPLIDSAIRSNPQLWPCSLATYRISSCPTISIIPIISQTSTPSSSHHRVTKFNLIIINQFFFLNGKVAIITYIIKIFIIRINLISINIFRINLIKNLIEFITFLYIKN